MQWLLSYSDIHVANFTGKRETSLVNAVVILVIICVGNAVPLWSTASPIHLLWLVGALWLGVRVCVCVCVFWCVCEFVKITRPGVIVDVLWFLWDQMRRNVCALWGLPRSQDKGFLEQYGRWPTKGPRVFARRRCSRQRPACVSSRKHWLPLAINI